MPDNAIALSPDERLEAFVESLADAGFDEADHDLIAGLRWNFDEVEVSPAAVIDAVMRLRQLRSSAGSSSKFHVSWLCNRFLDQDSPLNLCGPAMFSAHMLAQWNYNADTLLADLFRVAEPGNDHVLATVMLSTGDAKATSLRNGTDDDIDNVWCAQMCMTVTLLDVLDPHPVAAEVFATLVRDSDAFAWSDLHRFAAAAADLCRLPAS